MKLSVVRFVGVVLLSLSVGFVAACGGGGDNNSNTNANANNNTSTGTAFKDLSYDDKLTFMGTKVFPEFKKLFVAHDEARYKDNWSCATCHGADGTANKYKMPSATLFPLDAANPISEDDPKYGKTVKFMKEKVLPEIKKMLGDDTLTCFTCHAKKE